MKENTEKSIDWKADSQRFDDVADLYDVYRPTYPSEMIEDIIRISGIEPTGKILEIGSGTGKATKLFAEKGYPILCLEPGQNLINVATKKLDAYPEVSFVKSRFEEWESDQKFDLVISGQAYHWVPENVRYEKTASVMRYHGYLAVFWNMYPGMEGKINQEFDQIYRQRTPEIVKPDISFKEVIRSRANSLRMCSYFEKVEVRQYPWSVRYSTNEYIGLLNTYSDHLRLPEERRSELFHDIAEIIDRNGGYIDRPYLAVVYLARRNGC